ncbi:nectin-3-like, partial [Lampetra fluviatilis]
MAAAVRHLPSAASYLCLLFLFIVIASPAALSQAPSWLDVERHLSVVQGHNASLRCTLQSDEAVSQVTWSFRPSLSDSSVHVATKSQLFGSSVSTSYLDRATFTDPQDVSDGSLSVRSVSLSDEGVFTCDFTLFPSGSITGETQLQILVRPVISLVPSSAPLVAGEPPLVAGLCRAANGKPAAVVTWSGLGQGPAPVVTETANADGTVRG